LLTSHLLLSAPNGIRRQLSPPEHQNPCRLWKSNTLCLVPTEATNTQFLVAIEFAAMAVDVIRCVWDWDNMSLMEALLARWVVRPKGGPAARLAHEVFENASCRLLHPVTQYTVWE
jgi:hypothetical protein